MEEEQTWRSLLSEITRDPQERLRLITALGINPITLTRWISNKSTPQQDSLRQLLLHVLPDHRQQFIELLLKEYPHLSLESTAANTTPLEIPPVFYNRVIKTYVNSPKNLRSFTVKVIILQQLLSQLDPNNEGMVVTIAQCMPPIAGQQVRSLRHILGRGSPPWPSHLENYTMFMGAETISGQAVAKGRMAVMQNREDLVRAFPLSFVVWEISAVAAPLLQSDRIAGSLYVASVHSHYFSQSRQELIQKYANLLALAFEPQDFYPLDDIALEIMPPLSLQRPLLSTFRQRVIQCLTQTVHDRPLARLQVELMQWQKLEEELLHMQFPLEGAK